MTRSLVVALALLVLPMTSLAAQQPAPDPPDFKVMIAEMCPKLPDAVECFAQSASLTYAFCGLVTELAVLEGNYGRLSRCVDAAKTSVGPQFDRARRHTTKSKDAADLLKDSYSYWLTAMGELMPKYDEVKLVYRQRAARQKETLEHKLNRLKLEK